MIMSEDAEPPVEDKSRENYWTRPSQYKDVLSTVAEYEALKQKLHFALHGNFAENYQRSNISNISINPEKQEKRIQTVHISNASDSLIKNLIRTYQRSNKNAEEQENPLQEVEEEQEKRIPEASKKIIELQAMMKMTLNDMYTTKARLQEIKKKYS